MPPSLDAPTVRTWCRLALAALGRAREEIDAINVYPVADGDTGTNLYLTVESAAQSVDAVCDAHAAAGPAAGPSLQETFRAMSHGALIGARGNSGTILAQLLRGMNESLAADPAPQPDAAALCRALRTAADSAYEAVAHPAEGTMLTVAAAAATAAQRALEAASAGDADPAASAGGASAPASPGRAAGPRGDLLGPVVRAAQRGAREALAATTGQLGALREAGVVDAGGLGLLAVLGALADAVTGEAPRRQESAGAAARPAPATAAQVHACPEGDAAPGGPAFEVIYLLEAPSAAVPPLRARLDALGDSLVVVGGDGLWNVHVHVDDVGAAIEAGIEAGRPHRIRVTHFGAQTRRTPGDRGRERAVVALVRGEGMAALCEQAGAVVVALGPGEAPASGEISAAVRRTGAREVILLPNGAELRPAAGAAAAQARADGVRVALIPTRSAVQGIAALAVHEPSRRFDEDVVAMTSAAGATRYAELAVAEHESWTMAGVCQAGDVLGLIDGDVAVIGADVAGTAARVLDRMLAAGGEMVTLVLGATAPEGLAPRLEAHVRDTHLAVDTVIYEGGQPSCPLLIGVE
ncbi:DAK2 domain-containing protein [Streptomyces sp. NRRL F-5123]|uniref:DAK2 domain-containing protein n=1 Tax=Streptomyces sp. NRRL F-5123 TaxID=1463856 RepID=UPI0004E15D9D|nr:DAK2 domain-containing protein [Streptomyces sp. NRRL F-5123]